jgi:hypothetical protein
MVILGLTLLQLAFNIKFWFFGTSQSFTLSMVMSCHHPTGLNCVIMVANKSLRTY